jgi:hypothetical protein
MSFCIYDENGYVGDFATTKGTRDYLVYVRGLDIPETLQFVLEGWDVIPEAILEEFEKINPPEGLIKETHDNFLSLLKKCSGIVVLSDGISDDLEDEENSDV